MKTRLAKYYPEVIGLSVTAAIVFVAGLNQWSWLAIPFGILVWAGLHGLTIVKDNTARALYRGQNYLASAGPGLHWTFWPFNHWGEEIDTRVIATDCELMNASSADGIPFAVLLHLPFDFQPNRTMGRQQAAEMIQWGSEGRARTVEQVGCAAALDVIRQHDHTDLISGNAQARVQEEITREANRRLSPLGIRIAPAALRVTFRAPTDLEQAFIHLQATGPGVQAQVGHMLGIIQAMAHACPPQLKQYLDLQMINALRGNNNDPLTIILAREWVRRSARSP